MDPPPPVQAVSDDVSQEGTAIAKDYYGERLYYAGAGSLSKTRVETCEGGQVQFGGFGGTLAYAAVTQTPGGDALLTVDAGSIASLTVAAGAFASLTVAAGSISTLTSDMFYAGSLSTTSLVVNGMTEISGDINLNPYQGTASNIYLSGTLVVDRVLAGTVIAAGASIQDRLQPASDNGFWFHTAATNLTLPADVSVGSDLTVNGSLIVGTDLSVLGSLTVTGGMHLTAPETGSATVSLEQAQPTAAVLSITGNSSASSTDHTLVPNDARVTLGAIAGFVKIALQDTAVGGSMSGSYYMPVYKLTL